MAKTLAHFSLRSDNNPMNEMTSLRNQFLIAMPRQADPNFAQAVTLVCEHNQEGAMGIIINYPMDINLGDLFEHMAILTDQESLANKPVIAGGPMQQERGFVLHQPKGDWQASLTISDSLAITTSRDILHAIAEGNGPANAMVALGYAGWDPGQLDKEVLNNVWLTAPADPNLIFNTPFSDKWRLAGQLLGVDINRLSDEVGHS